MERGSTFDAIVIGLGAMGSAAIYQLARRGARVLGLDMHPAGHTHGSSHGEHRLIRRSSVRADGYMALAERAFDLWRALEEESNRAILKMLGEVRLSHWDCERELGVTPGDIESDPHRQLLTERELADRFPGFRLHEGMFATYEAEAGYVRAEVAVASHLDRAVHHGAVVQRSEPVTGWRMDGAGVAVATSSSQVRAERLVVTAGPWAGQLLGKLSLPLTPTRIVNGYFEPTRPEYWHADNGAPNFLLTVPEGSFYGMPDDDGIGLKIGLHAGTAAATPESIRRDIDPAEIDVLRQTLDRYMPGASGAVKKALTCIYTMTPDEDFIVDHHPEHAQVVFGCGFSGRGFKFSPTIGEILADLALDGATGHDIAFLSARRFG